MTRASQKLDDKRDELKTLTEWMTVQNKVKIEN
jgi:hypothetical protein